MAVDLVLIIFDTDFMKKRQLLLDLERASYLPGLSASNLFSWERVIHSPSTELPIYTKIVKHPPVVRDFHDSAQKYLLFILTGKFRRFD